MKPFLIKTKDWNKYQKVFTRMRYRAGAYVPTKQEMYDRILVDLEKFMPYLWWIIYTGVETEENKKMRQWIERIVDEQLEIAD